MALIATIHTVIALLYNEGYAQVYNVASLNLIREYISQFKFKVGGDKYLTRVVVLADKRQNSQSLWGEGLV